MNSASVEKNLALEVKNGAVWLARPFQLVSLLTMLQKYASAFFFIGDNIGRMAILGEISPIKGTDSLSEEQRQEAINTLEAVMAWCGYADLQLSVPSAARAIDVTKASNSRYEVGKAVGELKRRIEDELDATKLYLVERRKVAYYETAPLFGEKVANNLPSAAYDIEEAGKCFALSRNTACIMHLMRVVEVGLRAYGTSLGVMASITAAQPDWGTILRVANDEIRRLNGSGDPAWTPDKRTFFESTHANFHAIRVAWRNPTMHVEKQYDSERAEDIYNAVKGWMRHLAEHLDESGQFTP